LVTVSGSSRAACAATREASAVAWSSAPTSRSAPSSVATASGSSTAARGCPPRGILVSGMQGVQAPDKQGCGLGVAAVSGALAEAGRVTQQAAGLSGAGEGGQLARVGEAGRRGPEFCRRDEGPAGAAAVLVQVDGQPVARLGGFALGAGTDGGRRAADALARRGGVGQRLFQPVLAEGVPIGLGQVPGRGRFQG